MSNSWCRFFLLFYLFLSVAQAAVTSIGNVAVNCSFPPLIKLVLKHELKWSEQQIAKAVDEYNQMLQDAVKQSLMKVTSKKFEYYTLGQGKTAEETDLLTILSNNIKQYLYIQMSLSGFGEAAKASHIPAAPPGSSPFQQAMQPINFMSSQAHWLNKVISNTHPSEMISSMPLFNRAKIAANQVLQSLELVGRYLCRTAEERDQLLNAFDYHFHLFYHAEMFIASSAMLMSRQGRVQAMAPPGKSLTMLREYFLGQPLLLVEVKSVGLNVGSRLHKTEAQLLEAAKENARALNPALLNTQLIEEYSEDGALSYITETNEAKSLVLKATTFKDLQSEYNCTGNPILLGYSSEAEFNYSRYTLQQHKDDDYRLPGIIAVTRADQNNSFHRIGYAPFPVPKYFTDFFNQRIAPRLSPATIFSLRVSLANVIDDVMLHEAVVHEAAESSKLLPKDDPIQPIRELWEVAKSLHTFADDFVGVGIIEGRLFVSSLLSHCCVDMLMEAVYATTESLVFVHDFDERRKQLSTKRYFERICLQTLASMQFSKPALFPFLRAYYLTRVLSIYRMLNVDPDEEQERITGMVLPCINHLYPINRHH